MTGAKNRTKSRFIAPHRTALNVSCRVRDVEAARSSRVTPRGKPQKARVSGTGKGKGNQEVIKIAKNEERRRLYGAPFFFGVRNYQQYRQGGEFGKLLAFFMPYHLLWREV
jgi:hypothetical protein